jgi:hypothetical protein
MITWSRTQRLWWRWTGWVTAGEALGFSIPAVVGASTASLRAPVAAGGLLLAGACEGAILGAAQAHVLTDALPGVPRRRWIAATSAGAVLAWSIGLLPSVLPDGVSGWGRPAQVVAAVVLGTLLLLSIGLAQWGVLRRCVDRAGRWIAITAVGWLAGLAAFMAVATPLWHDGQMVAVTALIGGVAGLIMAATVAAVTGLGLTWLMSGDRR